MRHYNPIRGRPDGSLLINSAHIKCKAHFIGSLASFNCRVTNLLNCMECVMKSYLVLSDACVIFTRTGIAALHQLYADCCCSFNPLRNEETTCSTNYAANKNVHTNTATIRPHQKMIYVLKGSLHRVSIVCAHCTLHRHAQQKKKKKRCGWLRVWQSERGLLHYPVYVTCWACVDWNIIRICERLVSSSCCCCVCCILKRLLCYACRIVCCLFFIRSVRVTRPWTSRVLGVW